MGKDREGRFHPKKGKPSGGVEGMERNPSRELNEMQQDLGNAQVMHPNRNTNKKHDYNKEQSDDTADKTVNATFTEEFVQTTPQELPLRLSRGEFTTLADYKGEFCLTLYLPTHRRGVEVNEQQDLIGFKNMLQDANKFLTARGASEIQIKKLLKPAYDLLRNDEFWYNLSESLACFISDGRFEYLRLPYKTKKEIYLNNSFMVSPLAKLFLREEYFYILLMSKKQAKVYRADVWGMEEVIIPGMPNGVEDVVHIEEKDNQRLFRTGSGGNTGGANFHGTGSGAPDDKKNIEIYLDEVEETVWKELLNKENAPLLLAGIDHMIPVFKSVTSYRHLWNEHLTQGGLEHESKEALYRMAMEKMRPYFDERKNTALEIYANQSATGLTASAIADIVPAVYYGQVSHLFVREGMHVWGRFDEANNKLQIHAGQEEGDDCLIDKVTVKAILMGGEVFILSSDQMPGGAELAAVLRYTSQSSSAYQGNSNQS